jgi:hypothetical protein
VFDVCLFQETKLTSFTDTMIHGLWGHKDVGWEAKESQGLSGGLLSIWNKDLFVVRSSFLELVFWAVSLRVQPKMGVELGSIMFSVILETL